ncbi:ISAs1 family transposase [Streptomyces sp. NPDC007901]|uniref:ISAs1 family transposase n=1 Tax=Streptomyces sp. NPDC007901 TaxID=3364785 RepID=UPI0036E0C6AF
MPWTRRSAPTSPTSTARPHRRTCPRPTSGGSSPWTVKRSRARPAWTPRAGTCSRRSRTHPSPPSPKVEVGAKTNETRHFKPLLAPLDLTDTVVTFDALHPVKANITWLVETKKAHYIAVIKTNQPVAYAQLDALPWTSIAIQHTASRTAHGRRESRSIKTCSLAESLGGIAFPHAVLAIRVHRRRKPTGKPETRESVYAVTSLDSHHATPADLAAAIQGHWGIENSSHHIRDVTFAEDASTVHAGNAPRAMASFRNLAIGALKLLGADNVAKTTRAIRHETEHALAILGITNKPHP